MVQQPVTLSESHTSVLQELLLALLGCPGNIFTQQPSAQGLEFYHVSEPTSCDLHLAADLDWIAPADRYGSPPWLSNSLQKSFSQFSPGDQGSRVRA